MLGVLVIHNLFIVHHAQNLETKSLSAESMKQFLNFFQVLGGVFVTYLFLQTFAIPGSIFLSIISGYLFPFPVALTLVRHQAVIAQ